MNEPSPSSPTTESQAPSRSVASSSPSSSDHATRPEPSEQLDPKALPAWRINAFVSTLFYWVLTAVAIVVLAVFGIAEATGYPWLIYSVSVGLVLLMTIIQVGILPGVQWRRWRYEVHEHEIDLKRGVLITTRTLIPMSRVQHVDTQQGPVMRYYNLASVTIATAGGMHEIPGLAIPVAENLRDRISALAEVADDV